MLNEQQFYLFDCVRGLKADWMYSSDLFFTCYYMFDVSLNISISNDT